MQTLALVLAGLLVTALALIVLALALPLRVLLSFDTRADRKLALVLQPLGRFGPRVPLRKGKGAAQKRKVHKKRRGMPHGRFRRAAVRRLIAGLIGAVHLEEARLDADFGLGDPADTGQAFGLMTPLLYGSSGSTCAQISLRPVFDRRCLEGSGHLLWRITPFAVLWPLVRFGWAVFGPTR